MRIDSDFDGGSIQVIDGGDPAHVTLKLRRDNASDFKQWFFFRVRKTAGLDCTYAILDAGESSFPGGWSDYRACASYDGETWFRVPTELDGDALVFRHTPDHDLVTYACFAPYQTDRHEALLARARASARARVVKLGESVEGRPMNALVFGDQGRPVRRVWIVALQHPGETMAGWAADGVVDRLLDEGDPLVAALLDKAVVYVVPRMNPDGSARGNHRTNAAGRDLNREWSDPSMDASPEVFAVRQALEEGGVDLFLDLHGDETIPYVFDFGAEGVPRYGERLAGLEGLFRSALQRVDEGYQREHGYDLDPPGEADLRLANMYVAERFDCLSLGIELPFKDDFDHPDPAVGWSPERSRRFGRSLVEAVLACVDAVR